MYREGSVQLELLRITLQQFGEAERLCRRTLKKREEIFGTDHRDTLTSVSWCHCQSTVGIMNLSCIMHFCFGSRENLRMATACYTISIVLHLSSRTCLFAYISIFI